MTEDDVNGVAYVSDPLFYGPEDDEHYATECPTCGTRFATDNSWPVCPTWCGYVDPRGLTPARIQAAVRWLDNTLPALVSGARLRGPTPGADYAMAVQDAWMIVSAAHKRAQESVK